MSYSVGNILFFDKYCFTDSGSCLPHFGLILLPEELTTMEGNLYCSVITSSRSTTFFDLPLSEAKYTCFNKPSYACFDRQDYQNHADIGSHNTNPPHSLDKADFNLAFVKLKTALFSPKLPYSNDRLLRGAIIREWKRVKQTLN